MEIVFNPMILYHFDNWQVFEDDAQVVRFLADLYEFSSGHINWQEESEPPIMQLKENKVPKGLIPLERLFDRDDNAKNYQEGSKLEDSIEINTGTELHPKIIYIGKHWSTEERKG